jgi:23S rRNA (cytosine1962-C5)-methyltransferase
MPSENAAAAAVINDRGADRVRAGHPWVYATEILGWQPEAPAAGAPSSPVLVRDRRGRDLGWADYSPQSQIRLRLLTREPGPPPAWPLIADRLARALAYRGQVVRDSDACRLVAAEADALPGLIVDRYARSLTLQTLTWAMAARQPAIVAELDRLLHPAAIVERNDVKVREREGLELRAGLLQGASPDAEAVINGLTFTFDLLTGQKTGGFLDQRENWAAAAAYATMFGARRALDVFTFQGGFALHLARAGLQVEAVDSSRAALEQAERNAARNALGDIPWIEGNAFDVLRDYEHRGATYDCIVLDPPAFAKSRKSVAQAAAGYKEINLRALKLLAPGGLLVTCSCSHHLSEPELLEILSAAARDAHRDLIVVERRGQAKDHPVVLAIPETAYLKCIVARAR